MEKKLKVTFPIQVLDSAATEGDAVKTWMLAYI
jgi:hypothetical protein